jgi:hypothetical protein
VFDDASITESDIVSGFFRDAEVWYFEVDYTDTTIGTHKLGYGFIGEVRLVDNSYIAEFRDLTQRLDQEIGERTGRYCRVPLGSTQCGIVLEPDVWTATTAYAVGDQVRATVYDNRHYICTTAGTSGGSEPAWDTDIDDTTADNTVVWTCKIAWTKQGTLSAVTSRRSFTAISLTDDWLNGGVFTFTSGANSGLSMDVKRNQVSGVVEVRHPFPFDPEIGDTFKVSTGCNHLLKMPGDVAGTAYTGDCLVKFNNARRFRGEPETPGPDRLLNQS